MPSVPSPGALAVCASQTATNCQRAPSSEGTGAFDMSHGTCEGDGPGRLTAAPMNPEDLAQILPMGMMTGGHVTPIDHQYYSPRVFNSAPDSYEVYAPFDGYIVSAGLESEKVTPPDKISLVFEHSCSFWVVYNLLTSLTPDLAREIPLVADSGVSVRIPIRSGQLIGHIGGRTLDLDVVNADITLGGFVNPDDYAAEPAKVHVVDPFDYFDEPLRSQLLAIDLRAAHPRGGKIDHDVDGRLIGNWFQEGTNGYMGFFPDRDPRPMYYSKTHLAIVPDGIDPNTFTVSLGLLLPNEQSQFGVLGNGPDPAQVTVATGLVKYELVQIDYADATGQRWSRMSYAPEVHRHDSQDVRGTVLIQMLADRRLKLELFMGQRAAAVHGFTGAALLYGR